MSCFFYVEVIDETSKSPTPAARRFHCGKHAAHWWINGAVWCDGLPNFQTAVCAQVAGVALAVLTRFVWPLTSRLSNGWVENLSLPRVLHRRRLPGDMDR